MKRKFLLGLLAVVMCFALVGCASDESKDDGNSATTGGQKDVEEISFKGATAENWNTKLKDNFGMSLELPDGWKVDKVSDGKKSMKVYFITDYTMETRSYDLSKKFAANIFDELKKISTGDIYGFYDYEKKAINNFSEIETPSKVDIVVPWGEEKITVFFNYSFEDFEVYFSL